MRRRDVLKLSAGAAMLAAPHIARAQRERTLKFVPLGRVNRARSGLERKPARTTTPIWCSIRSMAWTRRLPPSRRWSKGTLSRTTERLWTMRLREGLRFHDGTPVLARDAVASIRRFAARDGFGQALMAVTGELSAPDDRTVRFRLTKPFPHLPAALAGSSDHHAVHHAGASCHAPIRFAR